MAKLHQRASVTVNVTLLLSEPEARAILHLCDYGAPEIADALGKSISGEFNGNGEHRSALIEFLLSARDELRPIIRRADDARAVFSCRKVAVDPPANP